MFRLADRHQCYARAVPVGRQENGHPFIALSWIPAFAGMTLAILFLILCAVFSAVTGECGAQEPPISEIVAEGMNQPEARDGFIFLEGGYFTIFYEPGVDLKRVYRRLNKRRFYIDESRRQTSFGGLDEKVVYRIDMLFGKVSRVLDMYPVNVKFKMKIFKERDVISDMYFKLSRKRRKVKSFYYHKDKTIYASEADITDSIIAHEMAHLITDYYFIVKPPETVREMMAVYADSHLQD